MEPMIKSRVKWYIFEQNWTDNCLFSWPFQPKCLPRNDYRLSTIPIPTFTISCSIYRIYHLEGQLLGHLCHATFRFSLAMFNQKWLFSFIWQFSEALSYAVAHVGETQTSNISKWQKWSLDQTHQLFLVLCRFCGFFEIDQWFIKLSRLF